MPVTPHSPQPTPRNARQSIATFEDYAGAQRAVDTLSDHGFPVEHVAIIGTGLRYIEQVSA